MYDFLIVGSGFFGSICARELTDAGYKVCVVEKREHIGGNCYTDNKDNVNIHLYGPHIFHTSNEKIWNWIKKYADFNDFSLRTVAHYKGEVFSLPFNMWTFSKIFNCVYPHEAKLIIEKEASEISNMPQNLEEQAIKLVGRTVYEKLIKGYTEKQWMKSAIDLPKEIIKRLPVRYTYDNNYFNDKFQGIPIGGYTQIFDKLLNGIDVKLGIDFFNSKMPEYKTLIYTGPIDKYFNYKFGELEYKTVSFEHKKIEIENYQGVAIVNETDFDIKHTRTIEHKHFENTFSETTWVSWEFPTKYNAKLNEPYYPVNDLHNNNLYNKYKYEADNTENVYFGGRLAEYKYYDMHQVISSAFDFIDKILK
jgi:UDP-galactopyranose mutase